MRAPSARVLVGAFWLWALAARGSSAELDRLYLERDQGAVAAETERLLVRLLPDAGASDFELVWRAARFYAWQAEQGPEARRARAADLARRWGEQAMRLEPARAEGHLYAGVGLGLWAMHQGAFTLLAEGVERKLLERLDQALRLDPSVEQGAAMVSRARYWARAPWPRRDLTKSSALLEQVLSAFPHNLRARLYLAENLAEEGFSARAQALYASVRVAPEGVDPPTDRWAKREAARLQGL